MRIITTGTDPETERSVQRSFTVHGDRHTTTARQAENADRYGVRRVEATRTGTA